jgi:AcrR family transcriptional regulator
VTAVVDSNVVDSNVVDGIEVERRTPFGDSSIVGPKGARTRRRILAAALEVFAAHGYHDSRIEQITAAAGCSRPTFYQYFSSKEAVFRALGAHVGRAVADMTARLGTVGPDAAGRAAVTAWMHEFADFYDGHSPVFAGFSAAVRADSRLPDASAAVSADLGAALRPHLRLGAGSDVDADVVATVVMTMAARANLLRVGMRGLVARKRFVDSLAAVVHRSLVGPVAGLDDGPPRPVRRPARLRADAPAPDPGPSADRAPSAQGRRTRARIVAAAHEVFPRHGFHDTRVDDIVAVARTSHGSFYRYFDGKDDLFRVIAVEAASDLIACIDAFPAAGDPAALRAWLAEWFRVYAEHGGIVALWRETQLPDPALSEVTRQVADHALGRLIGVLGQRAAGDPLVDAMAFLGLAETVPHHVHAFGYYGEPEAIAALVAIIRRGFLGLADDGDGAT